MVPHEKYTFADAVSDAMSGCMETQNDCANWEFDGTTISGRWLQDEGCSMASFTSNTGSCDAYSGLCKANELLQFASSGELIASRPWEKLPETFDAKITLQAMRTAADEENWRDEVH